MTLREAVDASLKAIPDEKTTQQNMEFLKSISQKISKDDQAKMQAVIDGMKKTDLLAKQKEEENEKKPVINKETKAQISNTDQTAQTSKTGETAQISNT